MFHLHAHTGCNSTALRPRRDIDGLLTIRPVLRPLVTRHGILRALNSSNWLGPKGGSNGSSNESSNKAKTLQNLSTPPTTFSNVSAWWSRFMGKVSYDYYLWRKDTVSDLQLFAIGFFALIMFGSYVKSLVVYGRPPDSAMDFWGELYDVLVLSFGQDFPPKEQASMAEQIFSVFVAYAGILSFAMVLALVEQVVLEVIDSNVKRGSTVYENGHTLVLGWCNSQRDVELIWKLLEQLCNAHQNDPGHTIVVLTQRSKIEMEAMFRRFKPESQRLGTEFVFRVGNPLVPADLQFVAAVQASVTIVVSDHSRNPMEADAQSARCAILLDEMGQCSGRGGRVVVQMKTSNGMPLVKYACSTRVLPMHTSMYATRRLVKMIKQPFIARVSQLLLDFTGSSCFFVHPCPQVVGRTFGKLAFYFPDAIIIGVLQFICGADSSGDESQEEGNLCNEDETPLLRNLYSNRKAILNPPLDYMIQPSDELVFVRPTKLLSLDCLVLSKPIRTRVAPAWTAYTEQLQQQQLQALRLQHQQVVREWTNGDGPITMEKPVTELFSFQPSNSDVNNQFPLLDFLATEDDFPNTSGTGPQLPSSFLPSPPRPSPSIPAQPAGSRRTLPSVPSPPLPSNQVISSSSHPSPLSASRYPPASSTSSSHPSPTASSQHPPACPPSSSHPSPQSLPEPASSSGRTPPSTARPTAAPLKTSPTTAHPTTATQTAAPSTANRTGTSSTAKPAATPSTAPSPRRPSTAKPTAPPSTAPSPRRPSRRSSRSPPEQTPPPISRGALSNFPARVTNDPLGALDSLDDPSSSPSRMESPLYTHVGHEPLETLDSADEKPAEGASGPPLGPSDEPSEQSNVLPYDRIEGYNSAAMQLNKRKLERKQEARASNSTSLYSDSISDNGNRPMPKMTGDNSEGLGDSTIMQSVWDSGQPQVVAARSYLSAIDSNMALAMKMVPMEYFFTDDSPENVLVCGWGELSFMCTLIREADRGQTALPPGSTMVFINTHDEASSLQAAVQAVGPVNISVRHIQADPMQTKDLAKVGIRQFKCAIVLCDERWVDPDMNDTNGIDALQQQDMLRLDSMVMMIQLNVRKLNEDRRLPAINIICQKVAMEGQTRFECRRRLPLGISMNLTSYDAKNLAQVAYNPGYAFVGENLYSQTDTATIDASDLCRRGERVSFWELMARAQNLGMVLLGYYFLPSSLDAPVQSVINPMGADERSRLKVWDMGDMSHKFVVIRNRTASQKRDMSPDDVSSFGKAPWVGGRLSAIPGSYSSMEDRSETKVYDVMEDFDPMGTMDGDEYDNMPFSFPILPVGFT